MYRKFLHAGLLACALIHPALAMDLRPAESLELSGGVYEFDDIVIDDGVTLTFIGEPGEATLRAAGDIHIAGRLVAPGWNIQLLANQLIEISGDIEVGDGSLSLATHTVASDSGDGLTIAAPGRLYLVEELGSAPDSRMAPLITPEITVLARDRLALASQHGGVELRDTFLLGGAVVVLPQAGVLDHIGINTLILASENDNTLLSLISPAALVPEPASWLLILAGLGLVYVMVAREHLGRVKQTRLDSPTLLAGKGDGA